MESRLLIRMDNGKTII